MIQAPKIPVDSTASVACRLLLPESVATLQTPLARLRALFLANLFLQALDAWVTLAGTGRGFHEANPLIASAMSSMGPTAGLLLAKFLAVVLLYLVYRQKHHRLVEPGLASLAVLYTFFAVVPWTVLLASSAS